MDIDEKIQYWLEIALDDLDSAKIMLKKKKYLQSGFYCHQTIEKAMKGYFCLYKNDDPPYTHNLLKLAEEAGLNDTLSDDWKKHIDLLMPLNIEARYPDEKREILKRLDADKAKEIYKKTKELARWIQKSMKK
jgi:HEPN domain-containing protein